MTYPRAGSERVPATPDFPSLEQSILEHWRTDGTFQASVADRDAGTDGDNEFVFYDGPPFANGLPHYGHLLTGYVKDVVPRYQTMRGRRVERRFGWDCHGLPAEVDAEKRLGIGHKSEIESMGVAAFNEVCRSSVLTYTEDWEEYVTRQARWVDFDNDYKTLDTDYMESVMWAFRTLWDKGLIYEGFRVLAYCWRCETPLSNAETRLDDVYRSRQDPAVTVGLRLDSGELALVWTTTPWTMPSNLAMAVHPDIEYAVVHPRAGDWAGERLLLAAARVPAYARELGDDPEIVETMPGRDLVGRRYTPPFDFFAGHERAHQVLSGDYVTTEDGTGLVHVAPGFGEEDKVLTDAAGIEPVVPVDSQGRFTAQVPPYAGVHIFEANRAITRELRAAGVLLRHESYEHPYPHCWRCDNPLIYKAVTSWFVEVTAIKERMLQLNEQISWVPGHVKDGSFGKWLANARDWSISRNRYWGSPIPVWKSDNPAYPRVDVYGSIDELERDFGPHGYSRPTDLHRPYVDELTRPNPDDPTGASTMRRVPEVLDCWFESGSMPFAQVHYPFDNAEWFEHHYPGDFIVEYVGQTRAWFYTLHVLATALFDRPAFQSAVVHGIVLGSDGRKMSKSLRNYPDVSEVFDRDGSDAMRWFLMSSPVLRGGNLIVTERGIRDGVRQVLIPLWNAWYFFVLYAEAEQFKAQWRTDSTHTLDRYVLAKTAALVEDLTDQMDRFDVSAACQTVREHLDMLTNWYVRRSRQRFWDGDADAFDTLWTALHVLVRTLSPLLPLTSEAVYRGLTGERSVHLTDWPQVGPGGADELPADAGLVSAMDAVREVCSATLALRKAAGLRVRLPLGRLTVGSASAEQLQPYADLIAAEVNVREVVLTAPESAEVAVTQRLTINPRAAGPRLGKEVQAVIRASKNGDWARASDGTMTVGGIVLHDGEYDVSTVVEGGSGTGASGVLPSGGFVVLDTEVTEEMALEGVARDLVRAVQQARRDAGLAVSDRIRLGVDGGDEVMDAADTHREMIMRETLATVLELATVPADSCIDAVVGDGLTVRVTIERTG
jgi:isoleucyl-tRNA synthetase